MNFIYFHVVLLC